MAGRKHDQPSMHAVGAVPGANEVPEHTIPQQTLFVCVRDRNGHGKSCGGSGSVAFIRKMRAMLTAESIGPAELTVRPAGCLGLCGKGPVCIAAATDSGRRKPPKAKKSMRGVFTRMDEQDLRPMLREVLRPTPQDAV